MLTVAYAVNFLGMILLPIILWLYFTRKFSLSWKLVLAGGLTFIASQVLHIPLVAAMGGFLKSQPLWVNAILLGLLAGIFEETARYILFRLLLKRALVEGRCARRFGTRWYRGSSLRASCCSWICLHAGLSHR